MNPNKVTAAAIQMEAKAGDVAANLEAVEALCKRAIASGARLIALPEFFTSRIVFQDSVFESVLPVDNEAIDLMRDLARQSDCSIGGSMLIADGAEVYNRYCFVEPSGQLHTHDKDLPTMWENGFYGPGHDEGQFDTDIGSVGAAVCWELIRSQTVKRLAKRIDVVMAGSHWWALPSNWGGLFNTLTASTRQYNRYLCENAPVEMARLLGVPVIHANHCGSFETLSCCVPGATKGLRFKSEFVGCAQIVDANGHVLASRQASEGEGIVIADITLGSQQPRQDLGRDFWIPSLPLLLKMVWIVDRLWSRSYYQREGRQLGLEAAQRRSLSKPKK